MENRRMFSFTFLSLHQSNMTSMSSSTASPESATECGFSADYFECERSDQGWKTKSRATFETSFIVFVLWFTLRFISSLKHSN